MVIAIFGESCTGKSTIADALAKKMGARVYTGKDYIKLAKNEDAAKALFIETLKTAAEPIIYVISETAHLKLLPERCVRVHVTADIDTIKERFAKRMNGNLPAPIATMLEKKHGCFDSEPCDLRIENTNSGVDDACNKIAALAEGYVS